MEKKNFLESKLFIGIVFGVGALIVLFAVFRAGELVGYRRAGFSYQWGDDYYRTFGQSSRMMGFGGLMTDDFPSTNGVIGRIIKVNASSSSLVIEGSDKVERVVVLGADTSVRRFRDTLTLNNLHIDDFVVVIGALDSNGTIEARLIRVVPQPPALPTPKTSTTTISS